jgi:hypothetical protein
MKVSGKENIKLLFQTYVDDIRYSKQQQWNIIYLTLIAISGIIALALSFDDSNSTQLLSNYFFRYSLMVFCGFISLLGIFYIGIYQWSMAQYRYLKDIFKEALERDCSEANYDEYFNDRLKYFFQDFWSFVVPFWIVILITGILGVYLIWSIK